MPDRQPKRVPQQLTPAERKQLEPFRGQLRKEYEREEDEISMFLYAIFLFCYAHVAEAARMLLHETLLSFAIYSTEGLNGKHIP